jgi:hypothetical protein
MVSEHSAQNERPDDPVRDQPDFHFLLQHLDAGHDHGKDIADSTRHTVETAYGILGHYQKLEQQAR